MAFIITVLRISLTLKYAFRYPGMPPHTAPPRKPANRDRLIVSQPGSSVKVRPTQVARIAPTIIWPSPPMLMTSPRNDMQMPIATRSSGVAFTSVSANALVLPNAPSQSAA
jgi:hypothetical protein